MEHFNSVWRIIFLSIFPFIIYPQWVQLHGPYWGDVQSIAKKGEYLFTGTSEGVYISSDNGTNWVRSELANSNVSALAVFNSEIIAGTSGPGIYISTDNGITWNLAGGSPQNVAINCLATDTNVIFAGAESYFDTLGGVFLSTDGGMNWTKMNNGLTNRRIFSIAISGNNIFAGTMGGVFHSTNKGSSWIANNNGLKNKTVNSLLSDVTALAINGNDIFAGSSNYGNIYRSTDNGNSWITISPGNYSVESILIKGTNIFASDYDNGVILSTDYGTTWSIMNNGLSNGYTRCLAAAGNFIFAGSNLTTQGSGESGVYKSSDNGVSWVNAGHLGSLVEAFAVIGNTVFAGTHWGLYLTTNYGITWMPAGLDGKYIISLRVNGNYLYAGTLGGGGIWRRPISEITNIEKNENGIVKEYTLDQNFPNPFNPTTTIYYSIPKEGNITLKIYDVLGREVITLEDAFKNAGKYEVKFDGSKLTSGVYFYRLNSGNNSIVRKMLLIK